MTNWAETSLGEACELYQPKTIASSELVENGPFLVYGANGVIGRYHSFNHEESQLLVTCRGATCGAVNVSAPRSWINGNAMVVKPRTSTLDLKFLEHIFRGGIDLSSAITGAAQPQITRQSLAPIRISFPPLPEQRRIAAILDQADALRAKRREALAQLDSLTQSIFIAMFGDPRQLPSSWPSAPLKALGRVTTGRTPPSSKEGMFGGTVPFITPGDLDSGEPAKRMLTEDGVVEVSPVRAGAALVCCIGTIGKMGIAKVRSAFNQQINAVDWGETVDDAYGLAALRFLRGQLAAQAASTTVPILNKSAFERFEIQVPPLALQGTFATRIQAVESLKATHRAALAELDALFASLQHRAFAGTL